VRLGLSVSAPSGTHSRLGTTLVASKGSDLHVYDELCVFSAFRAESKPLGAGREVVKLMLWSSKAHYVSCYVFPHRLTHPA
jgi:hypothetical protein